MPCDKDIGYVKLTRGLTWEGYGQKQLPKII